MRFLADVSLAVSLIQWLRSKGCVVMSTRRDNGWNIYYTISGEVFPQPPIHIKNGKIVFPRGSQQAVLDEFFKGEWK